MFSLLTLFTSLAVAMSLPLDLETRQTTTVCAKGVHIIAARGSTQPPGEGSLQSLSALIQSAIPGSTSSAVVYPALLDPYNSSEEQGVANMLLLIQQYVTSCPKAKLVLTGYSQGAQIIGDALGGGSFINSAPLAEVYRKNIVAGLLFGDPSRTRSKFYNLGNSTGDGIFPRAKTTQLDTYTAKIRSYCLAGDPICEHGSSDINKHFIEVETFQTEATQFVVGLAGQK